MAQLTAQRIKNALRALYSSLDSTDETLLDYVTQFRFKVRLSLTDGGTAGTAQTATGFFTNDFGCNLRIVAVNLITPIAVTGVATNNFTVNLTRVDAAGINPVVSAAYTSDVAGGNCVALVPRALTPSATSANLIVTGSGTPGTAGFALQAAVVKNGTGLALASATAQAYLEVTLEPV